MAAPNQCTPPTLRICRSDERGFEDFGWADNWMTFSFANYNDPGWVHFGPLRPQGRHHGRVSCAVSPDGQAEPAVFDETLRQGEGVGTTDTGANEIAFTADSEVLLFAVRMDLPRLWT